MSRTDELLRRIRSLVVTVNDYETTSQRATDEIVKAVRELDHLLSHGGALPSDWVSSAEPETTFVREAGA
jgi:alkyl hydroperoxide reductase subunit AhpC